MDRILLAFEIVRHFDKHKEDGKSAIGKLINSSIKVLQEAIDQEPPVPPPQPPVTPTT